MSETGPFVFVPLAIVGMALYWLLLTSLIGWLSGWRALAQAYPARRPFNGEQQRFASAVMRYNSRYSAVLTIGADFEGVYLAVFALFRAGHPPLFIPWSAIEVTRVQHWGVRGVRFDFRAAPGVPLVTRAALAKKLLRHAPPDVALSD